MATSAIDVRDVFATPHVRVRARAVDTTSVAAVPRRLPVAIAAAGAIGVLEAVALLAVGLTGLDGLLTGGHPSWAVAGGLLLLAGWIVLCAGSGAALIDGAGRALLRGVAYAEMVVLAALLVLTTVHPLFEHPPLGLPVTTLALLLLTVPTAKLLLAGTPSARRWVAGGPRIRVRRPDPVQAHRLLATATLTLIGAALVTVTVLAPVPAGGVGDSASAVYTQD